MEFKAERKQTLIINPDEKRSPREIPSEIRFDPLTGRTARICHFMKLKWPKPDFAKLIEGSESYCPFCPEKVLEVTPYFPKELLPQGRMIEDDRVITPNIAPYDGLSCVAVMSRRHYIPMTELSAGLIQANLDMCLKFFRIIDNTQHPESVYHLINWNYMPPSGSSLIHPHLQVFITSHAPNLMRQELEAGQAYMERYGRSFWRDLVSTEERRGERFLGRTGRIAWLTTYAPMGVAGDVMAVVEGAGATLELTGQDVKDLSTGLTRVMAAYDRMGIYSFNLNAFAGKRGDKSAGLHFLFSPRTFFNQALGTPDVGALRNLYNETLCMAFPEEIADTLRPEFESTAE
jgi:UDPglucose--hexose-1-phosphate uridylyltransferase